MAASSYYNDHTLLPHQQQQEYLLSGPTMPSKSNSAPHSPLKPLHLVTNMENPHIQQLDDMEQIKTVQKEDQVLKSRIRRLRLVSRVLGFLISVAVLVPITLTLHKFLTTKDVYHDVTDEDGRKVSRTPWANESKVWPTWMYFGVAAIAVVLNIVIIFSYKFGVKHANRAAAVATVFSWGVMIGNLVVWSVAAAIYRKEKKTTDLWGWTCSPQARAIQKEFEKEIDFNRFCNVQGASWYAGIANVVLAVLTIVTYILALKRRKAKKTIRGQTWEPSAFEPVRH
ncbi:hypothetical protein CC78DRAFT_106619 [Lojkania enalia]|uniref:MARVEL domain-containing protein n=1 Tax=Lojkania enalia TaxID=147567 RepID=A0A9P4JZ96_9PLEO|nr:hypothetical protein CC78DRAFT_106619 [Didymosphaeria enalia]